MIRNITILLISLTLLSCHRMEKADFIVVNAKVYTVDSNFRIAESFAVKDGKFVAAGTREVVMNHFESETIIDLKGKSVYPGFYDPHCHFTGYGRSLQYADLSGAESFDEVTERIKTHYKNFPGSWILGRGWDQNKWPVKEFPTNEKLNQLFPEIPVLLTRIDGHAVIANQKALDLGQISIKTEIKGGKIIAKNGQLTGVLLETAADYLKDLVPEPDREQKIKNLLKAQENCFAVGLTSVGDAGLKKEEILLIDSLQKAGSLKMKIYAMLTANEENTQFFIKKGVYVTENLNVRSIKLYADGALGSRGAALLEPYSDDSKNTGIMTISKDSLKDWCKLALKNGYQVNTHAIGDAANRSVLETYSEVLKQKNDLRWRVEHCQVLDENDFRYFGDFSIIPSIQSTHATSDMGWAEKRLGEKRVKNAYAYKKLLEQNEWLANGSDFPIENINPLFGFYAAVSRKDKNGQPETGFQIENALSREQALKAMTVWAAKSCFEEKFRGSVEIGKSADFVVLDGDIMQIPEIDTPKTQVLKTYINGKCVFDRE